MKKILVVDDNQLIITLIKKALGDKYKLYLAMTANEALIFAQEKRPDLLILDIILPDSSGFEVLTEIKSTKSTEHIPVILISAKSGSISRTTGYNLGAINYIEKPFDIPELQSIINTTLSQTSIKHEEIEFENLRIDIKLHQLFVNGEKIKITNTQFKLLVFLLKNLHCVFSRERLLEVMFAEFKNSSLRSVDNQVSALRKTLKNSDLKIESIYGKGYKICPK